MLRAASVPQTPPWSQWSGRKGRLPHRPGLPGRDRSEADKQKLAPVTLARPWEADGEQAAGLGPREPRVCCAHQC